MVKGAKEEEIWRQSAKKVVYWERQARTALEFQHFSCEVYFSWQSIFLHFAKAIFFLKGIIMIKGLWGLELYVDIEHGCTSLATHQDHSSQDLAGEDLAGRHYFIFIA